MFNSGSAYEEELVHKKGMRLNWPTAARKQESVTHVQEMLVIDDFVLDEFGNEHSQFKSLLNFMLKVNPKQRPSAT